MDRLQKLKQQIGISRSQIKVIAFVTMIIDHMGFIFLSGRPSMHYLYLAMRIIGRISFPLFCFLLVQGFQTTRNEWKYFFRLLFLAFFSEIFYDLFKFGRPYMGEQNVLFTLAVSLFLLILYRKAEEEEGKKKKTFFLFLIFGGGIFLVCFLHTDYSYLGVFFVSVMYFWRNNRFTQFFVLGVIMAMEGWPNIMELLALPLINFCPQAKKEKLPQNRQRFFYLIYPLQFIVLYVIHALFF